jgi:hypothetical protein
MRFAAQCDQLRPGSAMAISEHAEPFAALAIAIVIGTF